MRGKRPDASSIDEVRPLILEDFTERLTRVADEYHVVVPAEIAHLSVEDQLERVASMVRSADIAFRDVVSAQLWGETERWRLRREAGYAYRPAPYSGKIDLFRASGRRDALWADHRFHPATGDATWGWSTLSTQPVQVHLVLGDHLSMLREPFVANLAERVTRCLEHAGRTPR